MCVQGSGKEEVRRPRNWLGHGNTSAKGNERERRVKDQESFETQDLEPQPWCTACFLESGRI